MSLAAGSRFGPYEILAPVGEGGMGQVWRARDTRLDRDVALKVLPTETLTDKTARARLVQEARLASKLNHPHICTIYEVGESDGQTYIAMELVEGQPLSARLAEGPLPIEQVLRYGQQLADALGHAHERRVVHRDLKSANVVLTPQGRVKILDFGLAKQLTDEQLADATTVARHSLTEPGTVAGTLAYMAPEQLRGQPADARSDIWALGVVLYEMAGGQRPFQGQTGYELTSAVLKEAPAPLPPAVPAPLTAVIDRCLVKEPAERYQRGAEVQAALEAVASGGEAARWPTWRAVVWGRRRLLGRAVGALALLLIAATLVALDVGGVRSRVMGRTGTIKLAVLPFANLSGDAGQEYLSDGLTQEMITLLGRLHPATLSVIARTSVMRYKKTDTPVNQIGRELGVDYVLEGSAGRQANGIRITAELIKVADQTQVWADKYERDFSAIPTVQGQVAQSVARALAVELLPAEEARLAIVRTINPEAYEAYLKGYSLWQTLEAADLDAAERYFRVALEKDSSYAPAISGLAGVWLVRGQTGFASPSEAGQKAKPLALQALALDDNSAEAHDALAGVLAWNEWDWAGAEREWKRALEFNPNFANVHAYYAHYLAIMKRAAEAVSHSERALKLDPFNPLYHSLYGIVLVGLRRYDDALAAAHKAIAIRADTSLAYGVIQRVYLGKGMRKEQLADQRLRIATDPERVAAFDRGLAEGGYEGAQRAIADVLAARYEKAGGVPGAGVSRIYAPCAIAMRYLDAGDKEQAIAWLQKAYDTRDQNLPYLGWPEWDPLRSDARFQALLRRIGIPQ
jgi:eukaryotic-like serine/threonine-protein kinase